MQQQGLLGEQVIDFTSGVEESGLAPAGSYFLGQRQQQFAEAMAAAVELMSDTVKPLAEEATKTLTELRATAENLTRFTKENSDLDDTVEQLRTFSGNLVDLTSDGGPLRTSLEDINAITTDLADNRRIQVALENFEDAAKTFRETSSTLNRTSLTLNDTLSDIRPNLLRISVNMRDATDTIKRQPWRLVWPSTKKYPGDEERERSRRTRTDRSRPEAERIHHSPK